MKIWLYSGGNGIKAFNNKEAAEAWAQSNADPNAKIAENILETAASLQPPVTRTVVRPASLSEFKPQRGGKPDCVIASLATALDIAYDRIAEAFEVELKDGIPDITEGINDFAVFGPLFKMGWLSCPLVPLELDETAGTTVKQLSRDDIRELLKGHRAIVGYRDVHVGLHTVAWNGEEAVDCSDGMIIDLSKLPFQHAIVIIKT
jgi:hypothetical protein